MIASRSPFAPSPFRRQAPWGYRLLESLTPRGRGFSLGVRALLPWLSVMLPCLVCLRVHELPPSAAMLLAAHCCCWPAGSLTLLCRRPLVRPPSFPLPNQTNRLIVLLLTFLCYTAYHASRKPPSIVKSVLHGDSSNGGHRKGLQPVPARSMECYRLAAAPAPCGLCCGCFSGHTPVVCLHTETALSPTPAFCRRPRARSGWLLGRRGCQQGRQRLGALQPPA